jgi:hypothetical protein
MRHRFCASSHSALDLSPSSSHFQRLRADNKHVVYFNMWETPSLLQLRPQLSCLTRLAYYKTALSQHCLRAYKVDSGSPRLDISLIFHTTNKVADGYCLSFSLQALRLSKPSTAATRNFYFTRHDILRHLQRVPLRLLNEMLLNSAVSNLATFDRDYLFLFVQLSTNSAPSSTKGVKLSMNRVDGCLHYVWLHTSRLLSYV